MQASNYLFNYTNLYDVIYFNNDLLIAYGI